MNFLNFNNRLIIYGRKWFLAYQTRIVSGSGWVMPPAFQWDSFWTYFRLLSLEKFYHYDLRNNSIVCNFISECFLEFILCCYLTFSKSSWNSKTCNLLSIINNCHITCVKTIFSNSFVLSENFIYGMWLWRLFDIIVC